MVTRQKVMQLAIIELRIVLKNLQILLIPQPTSMLFCFYGVMIYSSMKASSQSETAVYICGVLILVVVTGVPRQGVIMVSLPTGMPELNYSDVYTHY